MSRKSILTETTREVLSPWVTLLTRTVVKSDSAPQTFHSLGQADYVSVLAVAPNGSIPLVRQYRPAVQRITLELPGGLNDVAEEPAVVAIRELYEETGFRALSEPVLLGNLIPDTGRLENRIWCYFVTAAPESGWLPEDGVDRVIYTRDQLRSEILNGTFDHALHIAVVGLALMHGHLNWEV